MLPLFLHLSCILLMVLLINISVYYTTAFHRLATAIPWTIYCLKDERITTCRDSYILFLVYAATSYVYVANYVAT